MNLKLNDNHIMSTHWALLDCIPYSLRGITISMEQTEIFLHCIFDGETSEDDKASLEDAAAEIWADFPEVSNVRVIYIRKETPEPISNFKPGYWIYRRKEIKYLTE